jgi:hypothetical protein
MSNLLMNEGCHPSMAINEKGQLQPAKLHFPMGSTFGDLCKEYTFFTYAPIILYGNLPFDPLMQFYADNPNTLRPAVVFTDEPIFTGLETQLDTTFNHMLIAVPNEVWSKLALHLGTIGMRNDQQQLYLETVIQQLPMADYLELRKEIVHTVTPMVSIYGVALDGNKCCLHFQPAQDPPIDRIRFVNSPPRQQIIDFAKGLFAGKPVLEKRAQ